MTQIWCAAVAGRDKQNARLMTVIPFKCATVLEDEAEQYFMTEIAPKEFAHLHDVVCVVEMIDPEWIKGV